MNFTDEQRLAIESRGSSLLVAAAAGSGKTAVLVERIISIICNKEKPVDIDRLLVVTFTKAAAAEMRQRISLAIEREMSLDLHNEHLAEQSMRLNGADISTIHAFCSRLIKKYFHLTDLDPAYSVADQTETELLKAQAMEELFEELYIEGNKGFFDLVECYGGGKTRDDNLINVISRMHQFIENSPYPVDCMNKYVDMYKLSRDIDLNNSPWVEILKKEIDTILTGVLENIELALKISNQPNGPSRYTEALYDDQKVVNHLQRQLEDGLEAVYESFLSVKYARLYSYRASDEVNDELKDKVKHIRDKDIKDSIKKARDNIFFKPPADMARDIQSLYPIMKALGEVTLRFREKYNSMKRAGNVVDYNDLEHYAVHILLGDDSSPTEAAITLSEKYEEILIDEYQDSSPVQELILSSISKTKPGTSVHVNRFMVGDIKQSIYKFRRADPGIFIEKYESYGDAGMIGEENKPGTKIDLSMNFRSRKNVLDSVNFFFCQLMSKELGDIEYDSNAALYAGAVFPDALDVNTAVETEIHVIDSSAQTDMQNEAQDETLEELSKAQMEAKLIAKRINELVNGDDKLYILDNGAYRPCRYKDIVVLTRSEKVIAGCLTEELMKYDIPGYADLSSGYFKSIEIMTVLSFLNVIDNPLQDIHIITVLHSPAYGLSADELLAVRNVNGKAYFYRCVQEYLSPYGNTPEPDCPQDVTVLKRFVSDLTRWRNSFLHISIHELITMVYRDTSYLNYVGAMPGGVIRQANLNALIDIAVQYENNSCRGLMSFIRYVERLRQSGSESGAPGGMTPQSLPENEDLVRIMTIHKSKGLEFPIVFVSMLGKQFNRADERESIILHQELGMGPKYIDLIKRTRTDTIAHLSLSKKIHRENLSEELRVLYVAMTRAKEKLILTGCVLNMEKRLDVWRSFIGDERPILPVYYLLSANCYLDWIMPCVAKHRDAEILWDMEAPLNEEIFNHTVSFAVYLYNREMLSASTPDADSLIDKVMNAEVLLKKLDNNVIDRGLFEEIDRKLGWVYHFEDEKALPSKISTSEIKRIYYNETLKDSAELEFLKEKPHYKKPEFLAKEEGMTSLRRGTAIHSVAEHLDLNSVQNEDMVRDLINNLIVRNILTPEEGTAVPVDKIMNFVHSETGQRIRQADYVKREVPFVMGLHPDEIYKSPLSDDFIYNDCQDKDNESILVHGIIDCYFEEEGEIVIVDYKSDYVAPGGLEAIKHKYAPQLLIYKKAVERSTGKKVKECILYMFGLDKGFDAFS